jgi:fimbrial isopeptide formation D2 family protein/uncharacterized repeat protein (TIGR01451 family)
MFLNEFLQNNNKSPEDDCTVIPKKTASAKVSGRLRPEFKLLAIEPRVMFDGAALATAEVAFDLVAPSGSSAEARSFEFSRDTPTRETGLETKILESNSPALVTQGISVGPRQLLVVDPGVSDWRNLIASVTADVDVLVLDPTRNGLSQIAERAQTLGQVSALHVLSHGEQARLTLAGADIDVAELIRSQAALQAIGRAMTADGDILLYGCDVGLGSAGGAFIGLIAQYTQADVAASVNPTGASSLGGDWTLEANTGAIETGVVIARAQQTAFQHLLAPGSEPVLTIQKGVVADDVAGSSARIFLVDDSNTPTAETLLIGAAGNTGNPIVGVITATTGLTLDTDESNVDGSDTVRYAIVVTNTVSLDIYAFDIKISDALPSGVSLADVSNFRVTLGNGTVVYDGSIGTQGNVLRGDDGSLLSDLASTQAAFFNGAQGLEFVDAPGGLGLLTGAGNVGASSGSNVLIVTYDVTLNSSSAAVTQAGRSLTSSASLFSYSDVDAAPNLLTAGALSEEATINIANASIAKVVIGTSEAHTSGTDVAIGEVVTYQVTITIPEGTHQPVIFHDCLDDDQATGGAPADYLAGMSHLGIDSIFFSSGLVSDKGSDLATLQSSGAIAFGPVNGFEDRGLTINFNQLSNTNTNNATAETITITYRTLVLDRPRNQEGKLLLNFADIKVDGVQQALDTDGVRVHEPDWMINVTPDNAVHQAGDVVTFTVTVMGNNITGFTGTLDAMLAGMPAGLSYVSGSFVVDAASTVVGDLSANPGDMSATISRLAPGDKAVFTFQASVGAGVSPGQTLSIPALVRYSSLPLDPDNTGTLSSTLTEPTIGALQQDSERTGAQGVGGALNDYARSDTGSLLIAAPQVTLTIVQTSEANTSPDSGNSVNPGLAESIPVAIGEVVRYRALVRLPQSSSLDAGIRVSLPDGLLFLNDGATTYALVSDGGLTSSTLAGAVPDGGTPTNPQDIAAIRPTALLPGSAITRLGGGTSFATGDDVLFLFGDLINADGDADAEWVVVEFNAVVEDQLSNQDALTNHRGSAPQASATALATQFEFVTDASSAAVVRGSSDIDTVTVREPAIIDLSKTVLSTTGNTATFSIQFSNTGSEEAYNVRLVDDYAGAINISPASVSVLSITTAAGYVVNPSSDAVDLTIAQLNPGQSVTIVYTVDITDLSLPVPPRQVQIVYEGLSSAGMTLIPMQGGGPISGVLSSTPGAIRNGASFVADLIAQDNYIDQVFAGSGVIAGRLWDDTNVVGSANSANGVYEAGAGLDKPLANVNVTLEWVGPGPSPLGFPIVVQTDADGKYCFAGLPPGDYKVVIPGPTLATAADGVVQERYESDGAINQMIAVSLPNGAKSDGNDFAFVQINETPTVTVPFSSFTFDEDQTLCFDGGSGTVGSLTHVGFITIGDPDSQDPTTQNVILTATQGILDIGVPGVANTALNSVTISGDLTTSLSLIGTRADINALLATLCYKPTTNYFGPAQISVTINDRGNGGDLPAGNGIPFEAIADNLSATKIISLTINNVADPTEARPDEQTIMEPNPGPATALTGNAVRTNPGANPPGDVADFDVDNDVLTVVGVAPGNGADLANTYLNTGVGSPIPGLYGSLVLSPDGSYSYTPNANAQTIPQGVTADDVFSYTISDGGPTPNRDTTTITIHITGTNDGPVALPDTNSISANASVPKTGNAVTGGSPGDQADTDIDSGEILKVQGVQAGIVAGPITGGVASSIAGAYGSVRLNADGSYSYTVNANDPAVMALNGTQTLTDTFSYTVCDSQLASATTTLIITINGQNEPPAGTDKTFTILEDAPPIRLTPSDFGFSDPDAGDSFKAVRIDSLPVAASGVLSFNGVAITVGQVIPFANINQIVFSPAANINSAVLGANPGFDFSVCDVNGPAFDPAPNRVSFNITPVSDPPLAPNEVFTVARDVTLTSPGAKLSAVQGPSDPDLPNDTLQIQVLSLPTASQGVFYRPAPGGVVPVSIGDLLTPAQLQQLCFVPSPLLSSTPNPDGTIPAGALGYKVTDVTGASANGSIAIIVPANLPPVAPDQVFIVNQGVGLTSPQSILNNLTDTSGLVPGVALPSDPDQPTNTLAVTITSLPDAATQGTFFRPVVGGPPVALTVGESLTPAQLQQLQFVPSPNLGGAPNAQGLLNAGALTYVASDGRGGSDPGSIAINVRPVPPALIPSPAPTPPKADVLVVVPAGVVPATIAFVSNSIAQVGVARHADDMRATQVQDRSLFDPFNALAVNASDASDIRIAKADVGKAKAERPQKEEDDCEPDKPKVKMKPKAVKRVLAEEKLGLKTKNFSEMLTTEKKRMKLPVKIKPKPNVQNVC